MCIIKFAQVYVGQIATIYFGLTAWLGILLHGKQPMKISD